MRTWNRAVTMGLLGALVLLLAACSSDTTITLYENEEWVVENVSKVNMSLMPSIGVGPEIVPGLGLDIGIDTGAWSEALLEASLNQMVSDYQRQGIEASWKSRSAGRNETAYTVRLAGTGWTQLESVALVGTNASVISLADNQVSVSMDMGGAAGGTDLLSGLAQTNVHLRGGRIVSSNADEVRGNKASWYNPQGTLSAIVTPVKRFSVSSPALIAGGAVTVVLLTVGIVLLLRLRAPVPTYRRSPLRPTLPRRAPTRPSLPSYRSRRPPRWRR